MKSTALKSGGSAARAPHRQPVAAPYHSVEIRPGNHVCPVVKRLAGRRFLSRESPPLLPLGVCDKSALCQCRYVHHDDRRAKPRRRSDVGMPSTPPDNKLERRRSRERRDEVED